MRLAWFYFKLMQNHLQNRHSRPVAVLLCLRFSSIVNVNFPIHSVIRSDKGLTSFREGQRPTAYRFLAVPVLILDYVMYFVKT